MKRVLKACKKVEAGLRDRADPPGGASQDTAAFYLARASESCYFESKIRKRGKPSMTKKQKKMLIRIAITAGMLIALEFIP